MYIYMYIFIYIIIHNIIYYNYNYIIIIYNTCTMYILCYSTMETV